MQILKISLELRYKQRNALVGPQVALHEDFLGEQPDTGRWLIPGMRMDHKERREVLVIDPERTLAEIQEPATASHATERLRQMIGLVAKHVAIPAINRWGVRSLWYRPVDGSFDDLLGRFRDGALGRVPGVDEAVDGAIILDFQGEDPSEKVSLQAGPSWADQVRQRYLPFEPASPIPEVGMLADIDLGATEPEAYSARQVGLVLRRAIEGSERYIEPLFGALLGGER